MQRTNPYACGIVAKWRPQGWVAYLLASGYMFPLASKLKADQCHMSKDTGTPHMMNIYIYMNMVNRNPHIPSPIFGALFFGGDWVLYTNLLGYLRSVYTDLHHVEHTLRRCTYPKNID